MRISVLGDKDTVLGFSLTGIKDLYPVEDSEKAKEVLKEIMNDPDIGVIILSERYAVDLREDIKRLREQRPLYPIMIEIPDKKGPIEKEDPIRLLIKRAVGLDVQTSEVK